jgi:hypothetical protein
LGQWHDEIAAWLGNWRFAVRSERIEAEESVVIQRGV